MQYDEFVGKVQNRARLPSTGEAVRAVHATLETLAQRLFGGEAEDLAAQLPREIGSYLREADRSRQESFGLDEFYRRVAEHAGPGLDYPDAVFRARVVMSVLTEAVSPGEIRDMRAQLPAEFNHLFQFEDIRDQA
ncbi:MAG: DUF2267 domain-containing protein [Anaerolineae bacterium]|nr:DUF2267 domain-containing protein [Anaerolineae bacterium]